MAFMKKFMSTEVDAGTEGEAVVRQCGDLLKRLRQTVPFPFSPDESAKLLLPEGFPHKPTLVSDPRYNNVRLSMLWGNLIHVCLDPEDDWRMATEESSGGFNRIFWLTTEETLPVPDAIMHPYWMFDEHPHREKIMGWWQRATVLEKEIEDASERIAHVVRYAHSATMLRFVWPELLKFVSLHAPVHHVTSEAIANARKKGYLSEEKKQICTQLLAAATLLEAREINAWVSFKTV